MWQSSTYCKDQILTRLVTRGVVRGATVIVHNDVRIPTLIRDAVIGRIETQLTVDKSERASFWLLPSSRWDWLYQKPSANPSHSRRLNFQSSLHGLLCPAGSRRNFGASLSLLGSRG
jgi:hypothetical protein